MTKQQLDGLTKKGSDTVVVWVPVVVGFLMIFTFIWTASADTQKIKSSIKNLGERVDREIVVSDKRLDRMETKIDMILAKQGKTWQQKGGYIDR